MPVIEGNDSSPLRLALIDARPLVLAGLVHLLQSCEANNSSPGLVVLPFGSPKELLALPGDLQQNLGTVILSIGAAPVNEARVQENIRDLRCHLPHLPLVLMCDHVEACHGMDALRLGIEGYIPTTLAPAVAVHAIRLVSAGGTFAPASIVLGDGREESPPGENLLSGVALDGFTERECTVLRLMWQGKANKRIAYDLNISESTVKVYVRQIMRKLGAKNRTHAIFIVSQSASFAADGRRR